MDLDLHLPGIVAGDPDEFARWVAGAEPSLRASLRAFARSVDTEAVLQEALLRLWQVAPRVERDGRPNALLRLGFRVAHNLAISEARRLHADPAEDSVLERALEHLELALTAATPDPLLRGVILRCREKLPGRPAEALRERLEHPGAPDVELAAALKMKLNTFLQNFTRARKLLAECLEKNGVRLAEVLR
jgi:DNA-directed RNA polymerase specialized sigma24 family protein